jgi:NADH-quinone oxidoreductase subunit M
MGLPGFSGFVAELQVLMGAWQAFPAPPWRGGGRRAFGGLHPAGLAAGVPPRIRRRRGSFPPGEPLEPITVPEKAGAVLLLGASLTIGIVPAVGPRLDRCRAGRSTAFAGMRKVLGWP